MSEQSKLLLNEHDAGEILGVSPRLIVMLHSDFHRLQLPPRQKPAVRFPLQYITGFKDHLPTSDDREELAEAAHIFSQTDAARTAIATAETDFELSLSEQAITLATGAQILSVEGIAAALHVATTTSSDWIRTGVLPKPDIKLKGNFVSLPDFRGSLKWLYPDGFQADQQNL